MSGSTQSLKTGSGTFPFPLPRNAKSTYFDFCEPMQLIYGLRLQKNVDYTINDASSFQTMRWSSIACHGSIDSLGKYAQTNARFPVSTGAPPVWRLPTGEIFLATNFIWRGDNGAPYFYIKDGELGFRKHYDKDMLGNGDDKAPPHVAMWKMMGNNKAKAEQWINTICKRFFGDGIEKSIEKDWLRYDDEIITKDKLNYVNSNYMNMLDSSKTFEQNNINKQNMLKCGFKVNRPVVTTEESKTGDYVGKW
jgi:hypothetical protein